MNTKLSFLTIIAACIALSACQFLNRQDKPIQEDDVPTLNTEMIYPYNSNAIRTPDGANALDLETPLRCNVN